MRASTLCLLSLLLPVALAIRAPELQAQQVAVSAAVPLASPTTVGARDLTFGTIMPDPNAARTVAVLAAVDRASASVQSGEYRLDVAALHGVTFALSTPTELTSATAPPLPVNFSGGGYGGWCVTRGRSGCGLNGFDPAGGDQRVCANELGGGVCDLGTSWPAASTLRVFVGGELTIPPTALAGTYTATITLTVTQVY